MEKRDVGRDALNPQHRGEALCAVEVDFDELGFALKLNREGLELRIHLLAGGGPLGKKIDEDGQLTAEDP